MYRLVNSVTQRTWTNRASLVDVHSEGGLEAHVDVVGLEALGGVAEQGEVRGPSIRVTNVSHYQFYNLEP